MFNVTSTHHALKEWSVAINALEQGKTIMLLRKGGIREEGNHFQVSQDQVLLYPTYEHQKPHLLKDEYVAQVKAVTPGWHPETVYIRSWAKITHILMVSEANLLASLMPYHIWNEQFAISRFHWKPRQPLYVLLLRTYLLASVVEISYLEQYGGCRSWIDLVPAISLESMTPVLNEDEYTQRVNQIHQLLVEP